jgi:3-methyladenine DNA glycosylase/8-oxoguanine DNA glycosylase
VTESKVARDWQVPFPLDVRLTLSVHGRCPADPTFRVDDAGAVWRTSLTPDGPGTIRVLSVGQGTRVVARAWGPGAAWLLDALPAALGFYDDISGFDPIPAHGVLREITARHPGVRVGRSGRLVEALVPAILEQKVTGNEAHRAWKFLLARFGTQPPGPAPAGMRVFPDPKTWRAIPSWDWHRAGAENVRAQTIFHATSVADSLERLLVLTSAEADRKLRSIPGIGQWTAAEALQRAAGDPDAISVGDYHLPKAVGWALAGRQHTDDATMLELLAPYAGHRYRVTRLVELSGRMPPRRGPRMTVRDYRGF